MTLLDRVQKFLFTDRRWFREYRIAHAKLQVKRAVWRGDAEAEEFWRAVLERLL
jgi:hypothetical protein